MRAEGLSCGMAAHRGLHDAHGYAFCCRPQFPPLVLDDARRKDLLTTGIGGHVAQNRGERAPRILTTVHGKSTVHGMSMFAGRRATCAVGSVGMLGKADSQPVKAIETAMALFGEVMAERLRCLEQPDHVRSDLEGGGCSRRGRVANVKASLVCDDRHQLSDKMQARVLWAPPRVWNQDAKGEASCGMGRNRPEWSYPG
jgi:hypothetical protein